MSNFLKGLMGGSGGGKPAPSQTSEDRKSEQARAAMAKIKDAIETVEKKTKHWESQKMDIERQAKASGIKTKAAKAKTMQLMKRRAMYDKNIANMNMQRDNMELQLFALESTIVTAQSVAAMDTGIKTQKNILDLNVAQRVTDELHDSMADMEELQATMAETVGPQMDESEFDEMWAEFESDEAVSEMEKMGEIPDAPETAADPAMEIPDAASHKLTQEEKDAQELMAFMNA
eukprot:m.435470 g.435470  ORF g.435470 m.435470 type:complete len:232 (-) comp17851_c0_seq1:72-767(-)